MEIRESIYKWEPVNHATEFTADDFFNLNGSLGAIQFNPKSKLTVKRSAWMDLYMQNGKGFVLYEMTNTSIIRPFSTRLLYNRDSGVARKLYDSNHPIYQTNEEMRPFDGIDFFTTDADLRAKNLELVRKYLRFFFDHVSGRHGFFYVCENMAEIVEITNHYYSLEENKSDLEEQTAKIQKLRNENKLAELRTLFDQHLVTASRNNKLKFDWLEKWDNQYICAVRAYMVFKNVLFDVNVNIFPSDRANNIELVDQVYAFSRPALLNKEAVEKLKSFGYDVDLPLFSQLYL